MSNERHRGKRRAGEFTPMELVFIEQYMLTRSAHGSAKTAGYKDPQCRAWQLMQTKHIVDEIDKRKEAQRRRNEHLEDQVLLELAKIGFADMQDFVNFDGQTLLIKRLEDIPEEMRCVIKKVTCTPGKFGDRVSIELHDKMAALEKIGKYLEMFVERTKNETTLMTFEDQLKALATIDLKPGEDFSDL